MVIRITLMIGSFDMENDFRNLIANLTEHHKQTISTLHYIHSTSNLKSRELSDGIIFTNSSHTQPAQEGNKRVKGGLQEGLRVFHSHYKRFTDRASEINRRTGMIELLARLLDVATGLDWGLRDGGDDKIEGRSKGRAWRKREIRSNSER
jgi:hypothetical protein